MEEVKIPLVAVAGPTASGKTALAVELALRLGGEVISADSMQIYKGMDIATAKPTAAEMKGVPHHLIGFLEPTEEFSVADYAVLAHRTIRAVHERGKLPILAGGTGLYLDAVVNNISFAEIETDGALRAELIRLAEEQGAECLLEELRTVDPESEARLHPHNLARIIRAVEVYRLTGIPMSEHQRRSRLTPRLYRTALLGLNFRDRQRLYDRIDLRVDRMLEAGLLEEARQVLAPDRLKPARQAIGYKELAPYFAGEETLAEAVGRIKQESRRYAKRQLTWFRRNERINWIYIDDCQNMEEIVAKAVEKVKVL